MVHPQRRFLRYFIDEFKYILCYGSSLAAVALTVFLSNLNTSYVMVHRKIILHQMLQ